jgi:arginase
LLSRGPAHVAQTLVHWLEGRNLDAAWLYVDLDVLDQATLPAVDSPGTPGLDFEGLESLLATLVSSGRVAGIDFSIYDPGLDPGHAHAKQIAQCITGAVAMLL